MTLKEELSLSHKRAIEERAKVEAPANEEAREMVINHIYPILRRMHKKYPLEPKLPLTVQYRANSIYIMPEMANIEIEESEKWYIPKLECRYLISAFYRVGRELDLEVEPVSETCCKITMTLDD